MKQKTQKPRGLANTITKSALKFMAFSYSRIPSLKKHLKSVDGWINFSIGLKTEDNKVAQSLWFNEGKGKVKTGVEGVETTLILKDSKVLSQLASLPPNEVLNLMLKNEMASIGNMSNLQYFNYLISVMLKNKQVKQMNKQIAERKAFGKSLVGTLSNTKPMDKTFIKGTFVDKNVKYIIDDPYLSNYSLKDFPFGKVFRYPLYA